jgi:hypothetical protein
MSGFVAPIAREMTRRRYVLLDTEDRYDAWSTGRDGPESPIDGDGLLIAFDGTGTLPYVTISSPDGEVEFHGLDEIRAVYGALRCGARLAEAFGPPIPLLQWRQLHG